ncbi:Ubiquitin domain-containing protein DSK2 [Penicillium canariense]|uniref:Ubiquitin domain-containing protein DSK2 n=1 Tax=Penicillium canariense TaxID=189055 RepID=A0A9W9IBA5_9EURO|nr:Ubiquitin domain-containing protein DSK2 [Penicillium canariense]KAJ5174270.1 Ubiquitin domain-containing protein DSK2 [Penicillium canariense]
MADDTTATEETPITFTVKSSTDAKFTLTLPLSTLVSELKEKLSSPEYADTPSDRQRLIYSGRVLKDSETLETYKIKDGHTIHLVKSAASNQQRSNTSTQSSATTAGAGTTPSQPAPGVPTNLAAGTGNNPLAGLTGARYAGFAQLPGAGLFGPDGGVRFITHIIYYSRSLNCVGLSCFCLQFTNFRAAALDGPSPDSEAMLNMLENPQIQSQINEALQNPAMIDMMIQQNPMLRDMGPMARELMQRPAFRRMLTDPASLRQMMQMQRAMGMGGGGMGGGDSAFPAPGVTNTTEGNQNNTPANPFGQMPQNPMMGGNPFAALFGGQGFGQPPASTATPGNNQTEGVQDAQSTTDRSATGDGQAPNPETAQNPFASLLNPALFGNGGNGGQGGINPFDPQQNPFLRDPALLSQMMQGMGGPGAEGGATGANPLAALFGGGGFGSPQPPDNRPPEDRYADQLRQLNDMGFFEFERNIEALRRSGGSVQGAVEYLLTHDS